MRKIFFIIIASIFAHSVYAQETSSFVEKELIIWLEEDVNATEFAAN